MKQEVSEAIKIEQEPESKPESESEPVKIEEIKGEKFQKRQTLECPKCKECMNYSLLPESIDSCPDICVNNSEYRKFIAIRNN